MVTRTLGRYYPRCIGTPGASPGSRSPVVLRVIVGKRMAVQRPPAFLGRSGEREVLDRLLETARGGQSAVLLIRGEAGIGKTALVRYAARQAAGFRVAQIAGVEAEMELPFAGLHPLCAHARPARRAS